MPLISSAIPNLVNGVSQQAAALRLSSQLALQENAFSSVVEGLGKRSPTKHVKKLAGTDVSTAYFHLINRDAAERYMVVLTDGDLFVYDLEGNAKTVAFPDGKAYLGTTDVPRKVMRALTVADHTFILNTEAITEMAADLSPSNVGQALISVKQGQYSTRYTIKIDGDVVADYKAHDSDITKIQTDYIAQQLQSNFGLAHRLHTTTATWTEASMYLTQVGAFTAYTWTSGDVISIIDGTDVIRGEYTITAKINNDTIQLATSPSALVVNGTTILTKDLTAADIETPDSPDMSNDYTVVRNGSTLHLVKRDNTAIDIAVEDSFGNRAMTVATDVVQQFTDLPTVAPKDFTTKIVGANGSKDDDYYVKFVPMSEVQQFGTGAWVETIGPNVPTSLDASTMPHVLVREIDGTFTFKEAEWGGRIVGDETTSSDPSFVGETITDIFFYRNRLGFLSKENVILSVAGGFFNFFSQTVTTVLDSDPVDHAATHTRVSLLKHAVPFREELLLFSDQVQFVFSTGGGLLTPSSPTIDPTTEFETSLMARPVGAGANVYFAFPRGLKPDNTPRYSGVREYFVQKDSDAKDASDVTAHVPKYIPGGISKMAAATNEDVLVALSDTEQSSVFVYKYYWVNDQKLQSSWSKFQLETGCKVIAAEFIESTLYLVVQRVDGHHLEKMSFEPGQVDEDSSYVTLLDRRLDETQVSAVYNAGTNRTTFTLPYSITGTMQVATRAGNAGIPEGVNVTTISQTGTTIVVAGDLTTTLLYIGQKYTMRARLSEPVLREEARGGGQSVITSGRLQVRRFLVNYSNSGYFRSEVTPTARLLSTKVMNALTPGVNGLGVVNLRSGTFPFTVFARSNEFVAELVNDSFLPCFFTGAEWEAHFTSRSQRA
jgi:hypothetical protein